MMYARIIRLFLLLSCFLPGLVLAAPQSIQVEWGYTPPASPAVTGFKLYQEGVNGAVCTTTDAKATSMNCTVELAAGATSSFTLTATFNDGAESPRSTPYLFTVAADELSAMQGPPEKQGTTGSKLFTFNWTAPAATANLKGYRIYLNNALLCETTDPSADTISCQADLLRKTMAFSMTEAAIDGSESGPSNLLVFDPTAAYPELFINARPLSFSWECNQAATIKGFRIYQNSNLICQTYDPSARQLTCTADLTAAPIYTLTAVNADNTETTFANALTYAAASTPPKAVISSSAAVGSAPLVIHFDGSGSTTTSATITSCTWSFGDGDSATGATASHTYLSAGTYAVTLSVADSKGQSNSASLPVIVIASATASKAPKAVISATTTSGPAPLTVTFNGGSPTDSDGRIVNYVWNFGDGSGTATGQSVTHTYTTAATFIATLQVTDDQGAVGIVSATVVANSGQQAAGVPTEAGEVAVSGEWLRVPLTTSFTNPIVVAGPPSFNNAEPCTVRIRNVNKTGFDIKVTEWDYLDGIHPQETVSYLVMEKGHYTLPDGAAVEVGSFTGSPGFKTVAFKSAFAKSPIVLTTVATMNDATTVSGRLKQISPYGFAYSYQEQEKNRNNHLDETVHYIAWEPGSGMIGALRYVAAKTANSVTDAWYSEKYKSALNQEPLLVAGMLTTNDASPAALRVQNQTTTGFQVKVEAEKSKNSKMKHSAETVGYIAIDQPPEER
ncbi:MAG: PKD domain-containing protein [Desulfobulbus sp.]|nr:PKD domain-containing protein [Desulfobulbus sp.]